LEDIWRFADELGPAQIIHVTEPETGLRGVLVIDNVAAGPAIGGLRMAPDVSTEECFRLARAMTLKNALASLPHGGAKAVVVGDPHMPAQQKERLIRALACALADARGYIFGPDMGTDERCMAVVRAEIGRAVGLPSEIGGIPLDELGATGFGLAHAAEVASAFCDTPLEGARVAIQGYGSVGRHAARLLAERGAVIVAASDSRGAIVDPQGLDLDALDGLKAAGKSVTDLGKGNRLELDDLIGVDCDVWVPAARPDAIRADNVSRLQARLVVCGANVPVTAEAERKLHGRGVLCVPDVVANAGGVICAAMEWAGATRSAAFESIEEKIRSNVRHVLERARSSGATPAEAARELAVERVRDAMSHRRWSVF
jgi:glutamate dehydrogenase (NAD(P)+)